MLKITARITPQHLRAVERAAAQRERGNAARRSGYRTYTVPSAQDNGIYYTVRVLNPGALLASCTCAHGQRPDAKGVCWHAVAALCEETRRVSRRTRDEYFHLPTS